LKTTQIAWFFIMLKLKQAFFVFRNFMANKAIMKKILVPLLFIVVLASCHFDKNITTKAKTPDNPKASDVVRIANDSLEYEVVIIDAGFNSWLAAYGRPRGYYSESYLENKNQMYVTEWNNRALQPQRYNGLYEMQIDYNPRIHYGYEVNYLLYNYMVYFQLTNKQQLGGFVPRP
jgi:hypothetical protein